eukprot:1719476-Rhodomonas_salina.1
MGVQCSPGMSAGMGAGERAEYRVYYERVFPFEALYRLYSVWAFVPPRLGQRAADVVPISDDL